MTSRPLRILHTPPRYYPYIGGVEEQCRGYARELARRGHQVRVLCAREGGRSARVDGLPVVRLTTALKVANTNITPTLPAHLLLERADVIHTYLPTPWSADWSVVVGALQRTPVILSYDNDLVGNGPMAAIAAIYNRLVLPRLLRTVAVILVLNRRAIGTASPLAPFRNKIRVLPPGIDTKRFCPGGGPREQTTFFFLSALDAYHGYKGLDLLLHALATARQENPAIRLMVGGSGPELTRYRQMALNLGLGDTVTFAGRLSDEEVLDHYRRCAAFVLPSTSAPQEGFGIVATEAMACAAPVIVSDVVGMADEIAVAGAGRVVPVGSQEALAAALVASAPLRAEMGQRGRRLVEQRFSLVAVGAALEQVYEQALDHGKG